MAGLTDAIEVYLRSLLDQAGEVELQRVELAQHFGCVPSQINYVLATRFTPERGYLVESRRGGGGFLRIIRLNLQALSDLHDLVHQEIGPMIAQDEAHGIIVRLAESDWITAREAAMMQAALDREILRVDLPLRDVLRAAILKAMLLARIRHTSPDE